MSTHKEKDTLILKLKEEIRDLKDKAKTAIKIDKDLKNKGMSVVKVDGEYHIVELLFDFESGIAKVDKSTKIDTDWFIMSYRAKEYLIKNIVDKVDK